MHGYIAIATDFELEPVIEQYLTTYPDTKQRNYDIVCKLQNEKVEGDYCYLIVTEYVADNTNPRLLQFIKAYCEVNDKVAKVDFNSRGFPDITKANYGNPAKYRKS